MTFVARTPGAAPGSAAVPLAFAWRYGYAALLATYFLAFGIAPGAPFGLGAILGMAASYTLVVFGVQVASRGRRQSGRHSLLLLLVGFPQLVLVLSHDALPQMPLLMLAFAAQVELARRSGVRTYRTGMLVTLAACALAIAVRDRYVDGGMTAAAWWTAGYVLLASLLITLLVAQLRSTVRKVAESARQMDLVAQSTGIGFWVNDLEHGWLLLDDNAQQLAGFEPGTFSGSYEDLFRVLPLKESDRLQREFRAAVRERRNLQTEMRIARSDGSVGVIASRATMVENEEGRVVRVIGASWQVGIDRAVEEELIRKGDRLQLSLKLSNGGLWIYDLQTGRVEWDDHVYRILGMAPGSFGGTFDDFVKMVHPADLATVHQAIEEAVAGRGEISAQLRMIGPDGRERTVRTMGRVYFDQGGQRGLRALKILGVLVDATDRKLEQERLEVLERRVKNLARVLRTGRWSYDAGQDCQDVDENLEQLFGVEPGELGTSLSSLLERMPPEERHRFRQLAAAVLPGENFSWRFRIMRPGGRPGELFWMGTAEAAKSGHVLRAEVGDVERLAH